MTLNHSADRLMPDSSRKPCWLKDILGVSTPLYWEKLECLQCIFKIGMHPNKSIHTNQCHRTVLFRCLVFSFQLNFLMCIYIIILVCSLDPKIKDALRAIMKENRTLHCLEQADKHNLLVFTATWAMFLSLLFGRSFALGGKGEFYVLESTEMMNTYLEL